MPVPILTIAGEMDGVARIFRLAEAYYRQNLHPSDESNKDKFPVVVLKGISHQQFASGDATGNVKKNDLIPEISE